MKTRNRIFTGFFCVLFMLVGGHQTEAQIWKKLKKKAEDAATRKLEEKTEKETNRAMDSILGNGSESNRTADASSGAGQNSSGTNAGGSSPANSGAGSSNAEPEITMYKKSDWVPGENIILLDDFADDPVGDFPQLWNTKGSGELITLSDNPKLKWLKMYNRAYYEPDLPKDLPKDFTIEFDLRAFNIDDKTSQTAMFGVTLGDGKQALKWGRRYINARLSPYPGWKKDQELRSLDYEGDGELATGRSQKDIRQAFLDGMHVAISVKDKRYRMYLNGDKVFDAPRAVNDSKNFSSIIFDTYGLRDDQAILLTNLRVAEGLPEPREKLFKTGSYSTTAITFDVDSDKLKPEAYGILKEIAAAINAEQGKSILIVGHTDSDGSDTYNLDLSKRRAASVKNALVNDFGVDASRLKTDGKGEAEPVASNDTAINKAKNRRTEFKLM
jgi:outer membrane protein OmpA-like peptidoglycan-associated protein